MRFTSRKSKVLLWSVVIAITFGMLSPAVFLFAFKPGEGFGFDLASGAWLLGGLAVFLAGVIWIFRSRRHWQLKASVTLLAAIAGGDGADQLAVGPTHTVAVVNGTGTMVTEIILAPAAAEREPVTDSEGLTHVDLAPEILRHLRSQGEFPSNVTVAFRFRGWMKPSRWYWIARLAEEDRLVAGRVDVVPGDRTVTIELIDQPITPDLAVDLVLGSPFFMNELGPILRRGFETAPGE